jgi:hypothetical protein
MVEMMAVVESVYVYASNSVAWVEVLVGYLGSGV